MTTAATPVPTTRSPRRGAEAGKGAMNRGAILEAAIEVFSERGYAQTTLEAIATIVGMTRPGVLHHFASKDALFNEVLASQEEWAASRLQLEEPHVGLDGLRALRALVVDSADVANSRRRLRLVQVLQGEALSGNAAAAEFASARLHRMRAHILACLHRAQEAGELASDGDLDALATLVGTTVNGLQAQWLLDPGVDTGAAFDALLALLADGSPTAR